MVTNENGIVMVGDGGGAGRGKGNRSLEVGGGVDDLAGSFGLCVAKDAVAESARVVYWEGRRG